MRTKLLRMMLAVAMISLPFQGEAFAVTFTAQGTVSGVSTLTASLKKVSDNTAATQITYPPGSGFASGDAYIDLTFSDNTLGFQAVTIKTDNRLATAIPKYTGIAQGSGLVGLTDKNFVIPLRWMVSDGLVTGGYTFTGAAGEFFMQDLKQGTTAANQDVTLGAAACNDANKSNTCTAGEFTDRNANAAFDAVLWTTGNPTSRCPSTFEGIDWDGDCYDGAKPIDLGFASVVFGISYQNAELSAAAGSAVTAGRLTTDGNVKVYTGTDYTGAEAQTYKTSTLTVVLQTLA